MDKMKCESQDLTQANIDKLAEHFPSVVTEGGDENGNLKKAVNFGGCQFYNALVHFLHFYHA